jgi:hypothetical protein
LKRHAVLAVVAEEGNLLLITYGAFGEKAGTLVWVEIDMSFAAPPRLFPSHRQVTARAVCPKLSKFLIPQQVIEEAQY